MSNILEDKREILALYGESICFARVGVSEVTQILPYGEPALHCDMPWFAIYIEDWVVKRVNALCVCEVEYAPPKEERL